MCPPLPPLVASLFTREFVSGVATAAYQVEGAYDADGKGKNIWDTFTRVEGEAVRNHAVCNCPLLCAPFFLRASLPPVAFPHFLRLPLSLPIPPTAFLSSQEQGPNS